MRAVCAAMVLVSCGLGPGAPPVSAPEAAAAAPFRLTGRVTFEARQATSTGVSLRTEERPARHVRLEARASSGDALLGEARTDDEGHYVLEGTGDVGSIDVVATMDLNGTPLAVTLDDAGRRPHAQTFQLPPSAERAAWDGHLEPGVEESLSGALHILDTLARGVQTVEGWAGERLPELYVYWGPDVTVDWSYYRGERGLSRFCLELLAGRRSERTTTDTDEHDEAIILHELGHFVFDRWTTYSSIGGRHPRGSLVDPGVAWEEGRATWLATAIRQDPAYVDSRGVEGAGSARVDESVETPQPPRGPGSETSVAGILWDLSDGDEIPDADADGVLVGPAAIVAAMRAMARTRGSYPDMGSFLRELVASGVVSESALRAMLRATGEPESVLDVVWPAELAPTGSVGGTIDGISQPAPSGGENRPENGYDAVDAYRVEIPVPGTLVLTLSPSGTGGDDEHTNLTLELRNDRATTLLVSAAPRGPETLTVPIAPGTYVAYVRDAGGGNRASYELRSAFTPD
jgi:hypothetical protein